MRNGLVALCLMVAVSACIPSDPASPIAFAREASGVEVLMTRCDELIHEISVRRVDALRAGKIVGPVLWAAESDSGAGVSGITIGAAPPGFRETVALEGPLPQDQELTVLLATSLVDMSGDVLLSDVEDGEVQARGEIVTREEFDRDRSDC